MGLIVSIVRDKYASPANAFFGCDEVTVVNLDGPFEPTPDRPAAVLTRNGVGDPIIRPDAMPDQASTPWMAGGTFAYTSDSRFARATGVYAAIPVHDYAESWAQYDNTFN